jgi:hypothetical protein
MKQDDIALLVNDKIDEKFNRDLMQCVLNGRRMKTTNGWVNHTQIPSFPAMKALIEVAFEHYTVDGPASYDPPLNLAKVASNACQAIAEHDWYGRKTNLLPLLATLVELDIPVTLKDIETLILAGFHLSNPVPRDKVQKTIEDARLVTS